MMRNFGQGQKKRENQGNTDFRRHFLPKSYDYPCLVFSNDFVVTQSPPPSGGSSRRRRFSQTPKKHRKSG